MRAFLLVLSLVALAVLPLLAPACVVPSISTGADAGSATPATSSSTDGGTTTAPATQGASCTQVSSTVALCQYISSCPDLVLNAQVFPQCGFRINGNAIDPECLCDNEYLCPIASPTTCTEAAAEVTGDVTYDSVCQKYLTGGCQDLAAATGSTGSSSGTTSSATCQSCIQNCDNVPACIDACGC